MSKKREEENVTQPMSFILEVTLLNKVPARTSAKNRFHLISHPTTRFHPDETPQAPYCSIAIFLKKKHTLQTNHITVLLSMAKTQHARHIVPSNPHSPSYSTGEMEVKIKEILTQNRFFLEATRQRMLPRSLLLTVCFLSYPHKLYLYICNLFPRGTLQGLAQSENHCKRKHLSYAWQMTLMGFVMLY